MNVENFVVQKVRDLCGTNEKISISRDTNLFDDLSFDSLMIIQLIIQVEEEFAINGDTYLSSFEDFETIDALCRKIEKIIHEEESNGKSYI